MPEQSDSRFTVSDSKKKPVDNAAAKEKHSADNPLIVDLPDGQKLVIGELADGSIIEIATWRGTGRPDSRTSRLMLGMANGRAEQIENSQDQKSKGGEAKSSDDFLSQVKGSFAGLASRFTSAKEKTPVAPAQSQSEAAPVTDELEQWLADIRAQAEKNVARRSAKKSAAKKATSKKSPAKKSVGKKAAVAQQAKKAAQTKKRAKKAAPSSSSRKNS